MTGALSYQRRRQLGAFVLLPFRFYEIAAMPFVTLVALSVYLPKD